METVVNSYPIRHTIVSGVRRPDWICSKTKQKVVVERDRSESMTGAKAQDAQAACESMVGELALPENKDGFLVGIVDFNHNVEVIHEFTPAKELVGNIKPLSPSGTTNITQALETALGMLQKPETGEGFRFMRPVALLFSDGCHNTGKPPHEAAVQLKAVADVVAVAFGSDADENLLRSIASTPQHFYRVKDGRELRHFMATVGATLTATLAQKRNATQALTGLQS